MMRTTNNIGNVMAREWQRVRRRPFYMVLPVLAMAFCSLFFVSLMKTGLPMDLPVAVVDMDESNLSRTYLRNLDAMQMVEIRDRCATYAEALDLMQRGKIYAIVVVPSGFQEKALGGRAPEITYYLNDAYLIAGSLLLRDITLMSALTSGAVQQQVLGAKGMNDAQIMGQIQPIAVDNHLMGNPWTNYGVYLVNLLLPGVLQVLTLMMSIYVMGIELKQRTAKEWLATAGGSMPAALIGKLLPYTILFSLLGLACDVLLYVVMGFPMNGSILAACLATILYVLATQSIAVLLVGVFPDLGFVTSVGAVFGLLGFTFAGFSFPIEGMLRGVRIFSNLFPLRHYFHIYVSNALYGTGIRYTLVNFAILGVFLLLPFLVIRRLKKAIELN